MRRALARADQRLHRATSVLHHLVSAREQALFSDAIVARVRGMLIHLAWQILRVQAEATGEKAREEFAARHGEVLAERFFATPVLISHAHALAVEWELNCDLDERFGLDSVLAPLLQDLIGHADSEIAGAAMAVLTAQTRFVQHQRRMELPLSQLDGECFHAVLAAWRDFAAEEVSDAIVRAENRLKSEHDESAARVTLLTRMVAALGDGAAEALNLSRAGVALFLSALAARTGQERGVVALSTLDGQRVRLALCLRAAGLKPADIDAQLLMIDPGMRQSTELDALGTREAAEWLAFDEATTR